LNNPEVLRVIGGFLRRIGKFEESIAVLERCVLVDPLKLGCTWQLKESYLWSGDYESSRIHADRLNRFFGRSAGGNDIYRMLLEGQPAEASQLIDDHSDPIYAVALRAMAAHDLGNTTEFENQMAAFHALNPDEIPVSWRLAGTVGLSRQMRPKFIATS
jgi:tetratricopeptide (TPR) repeat protein